MWIAIARISPPDAAYWPGRRTLALLDAIAWPALWFIAILTLPAKTGVIGTVTQALSILFALRRAYLAFLWNERYRFTTWRWGLPLASLVALGAFIKVLV
ncbi:MAG: hypothetical protein ACXU60_01040 [Croceibacterium sp.]